MTDVLRLTQDLIAIPSPSQDSNAEVNNFLQDYLERHGFEVERLAYHDEQGIQKVNLVAKKGSGQGGLGFFSHTDTVPAGEFEKAYSPEIKDGKLYGRGSCDMKGPLAATVIAAVEAESKDKPVFIVLAADEEVGFGGASHIVKHSTLLAEGWPEMGVIAEPTLLAPVYAHKGGYRIKVTATGVAAHTSTDKGVSANFVIAPFLAEMALLAERFRQESYFHDEQFEPATNGFNMVLDDPNQAVNVTSAQTTCYLLFRDMPRAHGQEALAEILNKVESYGLDVEISGYPAFFVAPEETVVRLALNATGREQATTVPFGTEALIYQPQLPLVILGPGSIEQAHRKDEWIALGQLEEAVGIYKHMISELEAMH